MRRLLPRHIRKREYVEKYEGVVEGGHRGGDWDGVVGIMFRPCIKEINIANSMIPRGGGFDIFIDLFY